MSTGQFHKLLSPLSLGSGLTLKNRMIKAPQSSWFFEDDGSAGDRVIDFYEAIAAGGVGLVIVSAITWRSDHPAGAYGALHDDRFLPGMKRLVERCHAHGCPVFCQLHHSGASAMTGHGGGLPIGPSDLGPDEIPCPPPVGKPTRGLTAEDIAVVAGPGRTARTVPAKSPAAGATTTTNDPATVAMLVECTRMLRKLHTRLGEKIVAETYVTGKHGINQAQKEYQALTYNKSRNKSKK